MRIDLKMAGKQLPTKTEIQSFAWKSVFLEQLGESDGSKVSNLETSPWQRWSIARSNTGVECKPR